MRVPLTELLRGGDVTSALLLLLALTTTGADPRRSATPTSSSSTATASSTAATPATSAPTATAAAPASTAATPATTPTATPTPSAASTAASTAPASSSSAPAPLALARAASPARGRRRTDRLKSNVWGLHLGIEKHYNVWKIFDIHSKEIVAARDVIFYERLTLQTYLDNLAANRDLTGGFCGNRAFASAADEADWDEQNMDGASEEAGPLPYCSVPIPMDDEIPRESVNAETYFGFADTGYVTPQPVDTNVSERIGPNFLPDPEAGDEAAYPKDANLPHYTQSGLQILGLVTAVHGGALPKEPANIQQAQGGEHKEKWREAMDKELKALQERNTWKVVPIRVARNKTILTGKWVFRVKTKADGTIDKFKARWVVRGFDQEQGRDFTETFAPVS
ncbi:unnamed protein product [Closterium sp. NIES-53]